MRMNAENGFEGFKVIDDATAQLVRNVSWVDDETLQYAVSAGFSVWGLQVEHITTVTRVAMNYQAQEIHVNEAPMLVWNGNGVEVREQHKCDACCQEGTCRRIDYCVRYKCGFGEAKQP